MLQAVTSHTQKQDMKISTNHFTTTYIIESRLAPENAVACQ